MGLLTVILSILASLALLMLLAIDSARLLRRKEHNPNGRYAPKALVIVPCKGKDIGLYDNLQSLKRQRYKNYEVVAVVDSERDDAIESIRAAGVKYIITDVKSARASGKVMAIATALQRFRNYDAYVIADSDIRAKSSWLQELVSPLQERSIGISTTFPYFMPVSGFWPRVKMVWGFVGQNLLENKNTRFAWGGSMAFRRDLIGRKDLEFFKNSKYSVSDDICVTMIARRKKLGIAYSAAAQPLVLTNDNFSQFIEWSNRQTSLTLLGYRSNFRRGMFFYGSEIFVFLSGIYLSLAVSPLFLLLFLHLLVSWKRGYSRAKRLDPAIVPIVVIIPFIYFCNLIVARFAKKITWRGAEYRLYP